MRRRDRDGKNERRLADAFRLLDGASRREAKARGRCLPPGRAPLRPHERPHVVWRASRLEESNSSPCLPPRSFSSMLDVAGGTGDIAFRIVDAGGPRVRVTLCDISAEMLAVGRERAGAGRAGQLALRRGQCRGAAVRGRLPSTPTRSPSASATCRDRRGPGRGLSRAEARRTFPLPRILVGRYAGARPALRRSIRSSVIPTLGKLVAGDGERLSLSRRIDPPVSAPGPVLAP